MSKELTPLEALNILVGMAVVQQRAYTIKPIIEKALKETERLKTSYLENLLNEESKEYIYKKLKVLEIVKEKKVDVDLLLKSLDSEMYNVVFENWNRPERNQLTQEEYELLKEVLL